jgi:SpoVK/Ycf46/Vps4 family AAA+-type ATPase
VSKISQIRGMWVGESEKNLKGIFREYSQAKKSFEQHPILLFNEADAIFSRRRNINTSVDQMENSMQNILLQELEDFEGIMIATTNLTQNLDPAFERRFLHKVYFDLPSEEVRYKLLSTAFCDLPKVELQSLAQEYNLTGSTIENIKRKITLMELTEFEYQIDSNILKALLSEESLMPVRKQIGFKING